MGRLSGKVAIVTGAGGGIGEQHALLLAHEGAQVVVNDIGLRKGSDADSVVAEIERSGGTAIASRVSATWDGASEIVQQAIDAFGRVDILVNNATAGGPQDLWKFTEEIWDLTFEVNVKGYFAMIRAVAPHMCRQGSGAIVNTSSGAGFGLPSMIAYASAKEGVIGLTRTVAREIGRFGVRCNAIRPFAAGISTKEYEHSTSKWSSLLSLTTGPVPGEEMFLNYDLAQFSKAKIARFVVWLCTDAAMEVNGRTFHVVGDMVERFSEPAAERSMYRDGGWDLDSLDAVAPVGLVGDLRNRYTLDNHPELKTFEE